MFRKLNETYDDYQKRMERRADILFPTMKDKDKVKKLKNLPLGKSIYDEDDDDDLPSIKNTGKIKSELEPLVEAVKKEKNTEQKSRKDRTPEEEEEFLNDFYPSMKHLGKDKVNKTDDEKAEKDSKKGSFTGGAAKIPETISNNENKQEDKISNTDNIKNHSSLDKIDNTVFSDNARKKARNFIQGAEDFSENAYQDEKGIWTIGYGHTKGVKPGDKITREEAEKLYAEDFKIHSEPLKHVKVSLNDNEKAALASLVFNIGESQFKSSTVLKKLNEGDKKAAAEAFKLFCKESKTQIINGKPVKKLEFSKGLYKRRVREMELFLTPDDK